MDSLITIDAIIKESMHRPIGSLMITHILRYH